MRKLLLFGYFGEGNLGDDLLLWTVCLRLAKYVEEGRLELMILSNDEGVMPPVPARMIERRNMREVNSAVRESDIVCAPGGGLLQDSTSLKSLLYYLNIIRTASRYGKKVILLAQGLGPITSFFGRLFASRILPKVDYLSVRDRRSGELCKLISKGLPVAPVTADLSFSLEPVLLPGEVGQVGLTASEAYRILVCPKPSKGLRKQNALLLTALLAARRLTMGRKVEFSILALNRKEDSGIAEVIAEKLGGTLTIYDGQNPLSLISHFRNADSVLSYRLHGSVLSAQSRCPFVSITYDPKVASFTERFSQASFQSQLIKPNEIGEALSLALKNGFSDEADQALRESKGLSETDIDVLETLIEQE